MMNKREDEQKYDTDSQVNSMEQEVIQHRPEKIELIQEDLDPSRIVQLKLKSDVVRMKKPSRKKWSQKKKAWMECDVERELAKIYKRMGIPNPDAGEEPLDNGESS